jgi:soluble lytic murein transglycosylase
VTRTLTLASATAFVLMAGGPHAQQVTPALVTLVPTSHPSVPRDLSLLWLAPEGGRRPRVPGLTEFESAVKLEVDGHFAQALPILSQPSVVQGSLGHYAQYYKGLAELRLGRPEDARRTFQALLAREVVGYLVEAAALREAECDEALGDPAAALRLYERLAATKTMAQDDILMRVGRAARAAGDRDKASQAFARVYYDFPLGDFALSAATEIESGPIAWDSRRYKLALERAERLFAARRYGQVRGEFQALHAVARDDDLELVSLRIAECDYFLKRPRIARDELRPYLEHASRRAEALFFHAVASRDLGDTGEYLRTVQRIVAEFPGHSWAEEALNDVASYWIRQDGTENADAALRNLYAQFPTGRYAERAAWKIGWSAFRGRQYVDAASFFDRGSFDFARSDYRPAWLYWSGRAHEALKEDALAEARYSLAATDYLNSYYGRLAAGRLTELGLLLPARRLVVDVRVPAVIDSAEREAISSPAAPWLPPNEAVVRALLGLDLYDQALDELRYAQRAWGDSSAIEATMAWIYMQQGRVESGLQQFTLFRGAINAMKRAYPQFLAAGGEDLPREVLQIIFPMSYWDVIRKYAVEYHIDPFLAAALISQESTFVPDIKSAANAVGLMQLLPSTARQVAKTLKMPFTPRLLTNPDANIRIGMAYLAAKIRQFGDVHLVLASYNAGEGSVHRWLSERPGIARDEFIDDIPYPETQNYVKKILGTAEDYRRLYGSELLRTEPSFADAAAAAVAVAPVVPATSVRGPARKATPRKRAAAAAPAKTPTATKTPVTRKAPAARKKKARIAA